MKIDIGLCKLSALVKHIKMLKGFLFILLFLINIATCIKRVSLDINRPNDPNFVTESTMVEGRRCIYIVPRGGVNTITVYHGDQIIWEKTHENQLLGYVRLTPGPNGRMVISSSVPGERKILDHYSFYQEKWLKFKTFDSLQARQQRMKEYMERKKLGLKPRLEDESFASVDLEESSKSETTDKEQKQSSSDTKKQESENVEQSKKDLDAEKPDPEVIVEQIILLAKIDEERMKDKDDPEKQDNDQERDNQINEPEKGVQRDDKSKESTQQNKVLTDIDVLTKFQELVSEGDYGLDKKDTSKDTDDDGSYRTCLEFHMESSGCDECNGHEDSKLCLVGSKSTDPSPERNQDEDKSKKDVELQKGLVYLGSKILIYLGLRTCSIGSKFVDPGDSLDEILGAMTESDDEDGFSSRIIGGPESDDDRRASSFKPPYDQIYVGFSKDDDVFDQEPESDDQGFLFFSDSDSCDEEIRNILKTQKSSDNTDEENNLDELQGATGGYEGFEQKTRRSRSMRFRKKEKPIKKTSKRSGRSFSTKLAAYAKGDLKLGYKSLSRKSSDHSSRPASQVSSGYTIVETKDPSVDGLILTKPSDEPPKDSKKTPRLVLRGHSESDLAILLQDKKLDEFRQKSETDIRNIDSLPPGSHSAPSSLLRPKKKFQLKTESIPDDYSESSDDLSKKNNKKTLSHRLLSFLVKEGIKRGMDEVNKHKAKKESLKEKQKQDSQSKEDEEDVIGPMPSECSAEDDKSTDSGKIDKPEDDVILFSATEEKAEAEVPTEQAEESKESEEPKTEEPKTVDETTTPTEPTAESHPSDQDGSVEQTQEQSDQHEEDPEQKSEDKPRKYDKDLYEFLGARPKAKPTHKFKIKKTKLKEKLEIPDIVVQDPEGNTIEPTIDDPKKKDNKRKKDVDKSKTKSKSKDKKSKRDEVEVSANDEFSYKVMPKRSSSKERSKKKEKKEKETEEEEDDGNNPNDKCKPIKSTVRWDDEDDDDHRARREEISRMYLEETPGCCPIS